MSGAPVRYVRSILTYGALSLGEKGRQLENKTKKGVWSKKQADSWPMLSPNVHSGLQQFSPGQHFACSQQNLC